MGEPSAAGARSRHGFLGNLFAGRLRWDLIAPFPEPALAGRQAGDEVVREMRALVREVVDPEVVEQTGQLPPTYVDELRKRRLLNLHVPVEIGGRGLSYYDVFRVVETAMSWSLPAGYVVAVHNGIGVAGVLDAIPEGETKEYVRSMLASGAVSGWADTETTGAGNAMPLTTATPTENGAAYLIDGEKIFTVNGSIAGLLNVSATVKTPHGDETHVFLVDTKTPGFRVSLVHELMGLRGLPIAQMVFDKVRVPKERMLAAEEGHWRLTPLLEPLSALGRMYIVVAASQATAKNCLAWSRAFVKCRHVDGRPLATYDEIQRRCASSAADVFAIESVSRFCLVDVDRDRLPLRWFEQVAAKNIASIICARVADRTMSLFAAEGYETAASKLRREARALPVERAYRDARAFRIAGGVEFLVDFAAAKAGIFTTYERADERAADPTFDVARLSVRNRAHLDALRTEVEDFGRTCRAIAEKHGDAVFERQRTLILASTIANELFAMSAVLSRAASEGGAAGDLADVFCVGARERTEDARRQLGSELEPEYARITQEWLASEADQEPG